MKDGKQKKANPPQIAHTTEALASDSLYPTSRTGRKDRGEGLRSMWSIEKDTGTKRERGTEKEKEIRKGEGGRKRMTRRKGQWNQGDRALALPSQTTLQLPLCVSGTLCFHHL